MTYKADISYLKYPAQMAHQGEGASCIFLSPCADAVVTPLLLNNAHECLILSPFTLTADQ